jgi:hypothetical protein
MPFIITNYFSYLTLVLSIIGIIIWIIWGFRHLKYSGFTISALSWLFHVFLFNVLHLMHIVTNPLFLNDWSQVIRIHALIAIIGTGIILFSSRKKQEKSCQMTL